MGNQYDPIGDLLARIRNGQERGLAKIATPASKLRGRVLDVLKSRRASFRGLFRGPGTKASSGPQVRDRIEISRGASPVIRELCAVSTHRTPACQQLASRAQI